MMGFPDLWTILTHAGVTHPGADASTKGLSIDWSQLGGVVTAVGALGVAAFGATEALGKAFAFTLPIGKTKVWHIGLPYVGFRAVKHLCKLLSPALECAYGADYLDVIAQQYRADRGDGRAPDTLRQGVRLGLPFLSVEKASELIGRIWDLEPKYAQALATALQADSLKTPYATEPAEGADPSPQPDGSAGLQALAGRFSTALDARVNATFAFADEQYEAQAKLVAGVVAILLAFGFNATLNPGYAPLMVFGVGLVAVPLGPVAKDLSTSLQNALTAFKSIPGRQV